MREIFPNLFLVHARTTDAGFSYLLRRKQGNFLLPAFNRELIDAQLDAIHALGGISAVYINGKHNAKIANLPNQLIKRYHPPIHISDIDAKTYRQPLPNIAPLPFQRQRIADDFDAIPFAGYSKGGMAYVWRNGGKQYLFAGISITRADGQWRTWVSSTVTPRRFNTALKELQSMPCDVLVLNSFGNTEDPWFTFTAARWHQFFEDLIANPNPGKRT